AYQAGPLEARGFEQRGDGRASSPTLSVGNIDGSISALCLFFDGLVGARLIVRETYAHYLDAANFAEGNPQADPSQERLNIWFLEQKTAENSVQVTWELSA
ncbi:phage minor tail protein L, partial [Pseudomonas aeruginosa]